MFFTNTAVCVLIGACFVFDLVRRCTEHVLHTVLIGALSLTWSEGVQNMYCALF